MGAENGHLTLSIFFPRLDQNVTGHCERLPVRWLNTEHELKGGLYKCSETAGSECDGFSTRCRPMESASPRLRMRREREDGTRGEVPRLLTVYVGHVVEAQVCARKLFKRPSFLVLDDVLEALLRLVPLVRPAEAHLPQGSLKHLRGKKAVGEERRHGGKLGCLPQACRRTFGRSAQTRCSTSTLAPALTWHTTL